MKIEPNINYFAVLLTRMIAVFIVLLLMKVCSNGLLQDASWWWITFPLWFPASLLLVWCCIALLIYTIASTEWVGTADPDGENF